MGGQRDCHLIIFAHTFLLEIFREYSVGRIFDSFNVG